MNFFIVFKLLGLLLVTVGGAMLPSLLWSVGEGDGAIGAISEAMTITLGCGGVMFAIGRMRPQELFRKEATAVVGLGWLLTAAAGALPFYFYDGAFPSFVDCYFESMSGFTTTGSSVLAGADFATLPMGLHFWRCSTHWLGGMGIIVLFVAILPFLGAGGRALIKYEVPGPVTDSLTPRVKDTAMIMWQIYCLFTLVETVLLKIFGMTWFEALCHSFATLATGGFSTNPESIAGFHSLPMELIIVFFMLVAGTNFSLYYSVFRDNPRALWRDPEWRGYMGIIVGCSLITTILLLAANTYESFSESLRHAVFQVPCLMTTTGFASTNTETWPVSLKVLLVILMFVGGSAGSTGGGIKVMRWMILVKAGWGQLEHVYSPRTIRKLRLGKSVLSDELLASTLVFFFVWIAVFVIGVLGVALLEGSKYDLETTFTAVVATFNNIGPGFGKVGVTGNFAFFEPSTKILLSFLMVLGRLELYTILVLFAPRFWKEK